MNAELRTARIAKAMNVDELMTKPNVVGVGVGYKAIGEETTDELAVVVSVVSKIEAGLLAEHELIPAQVRGIPTDVVQTGEIRVRQGTTDRWRPSPGGVSISHVDITAGTLGCLVGRDGEWFILSNNHVLAASNQGKIGDPILQPGTADGGTIDDVIAELEDFVPVKMSVGIPDCPVASAVADVVSFIGKLLGSKHRMRAIQQEDDVNLVDAAIARPLFEDDVIRDILGCGTPTGIAEAELGMSIKKSGRTTGLTTGKVTQIDMTVSVMYPPFGIATFEDQIAGDIHCEGGDSGSAVLNDDNNVVGLLFAGGEGITIMNKIVNVIDLLAVEIY